MTPLQLSTLESEIKKEFEVLQKSISAYAEQTLKGESE